MASSFPNQADVVVERPSTIVKSPPTVFFESDVQHSHRSRHQIDFENPVIAGSPIFSASERSLDSLTLCSSWNETTKEINSLVNEHVPVTVDFVGAGYDSLIPHHFLLKSSFFRSGANMQVGDNIQRIVRVGSVAEVGCDFVSFHSEFPASRKKVGVVVVPDGVWGGKDVSSWRLWRRFLPMKLRSLKDFEISLRRPEELVFTPLVITSPPPYSSFDFSSQEEGGVSVSVVGKEYEERFCLDSFFED